MKGLWRAYVLSNVHIALCAVAFCWAGYDFFGIEVDLLVLTFLFAGSLCTYTLHRMISGGRLTAITTGHERFSFINKIGRWKTLYIVLLILVSLFSFSMLSQSLRFYLAGLSFLSIGYIIPILGSEKRLRDINMLKIFLVAFVWAGIFFVPLFGTDQILLSSHSLLLFLEKFLFVFALTLPFDIRDREIDQGTQLSTFGNVLSVQHIKLLMSILLLLCILLTGYLGYIVVYSLSQTLTIIGLYGVQAVVSLRVTTTTSELYYLGLLDGLILIQGAALVILSN